MTQESKNTAVWVSLGALLLAVFAAIVSASMSAGALQTRVSALEKRADESQIQSVSQAEWGQFARDMRDRLDRIEKKLDTGK